MYQISDQMTLFLVRYGEIGLKSDAVRKRFEHCLITNIEKAFIREKAECKVSSDRGHIYVAAEDVKVANLVLAHTFGVTSYSKVDLLSSDVDRICDYLKDWSQKKLKKGQTFAVRSRRTGKHKFTSQDVAVRTGDAIRLANQNKGIKVDLESPDVEIYIEIRDNRAYIYTEKVEGPGGMPLGSQGKVIALVTDDEDAMACWLLMKRGCHPIVIPVGKTTSLGLLKRWSPSGELVLGPPMGRIDEKAIDDILDLAKMKRASAIVLGERERPFKKRDFPIFYPLIGVTDDMFKTLFKRMND
jgi:thiamine biosynthesis protein ThiI